MMMNLDWRDPFVVAFELSLYVIGCVLVAFVALLTTAIIIAFVKAFRGLFRKNKQTQVERVILRSIE